MKSMIERLEELKIKPKVPESHHAVLINGKIDEAITIAQEAREYMIDEIDQKRINNDLWRMSKSEFEDFVLDKIDEIIGRSD